MIIGDRLRSLREAKKLSQGDIEKRTGHLRPKPRARWQVLIDTLLLPTSPESSAFLDV
jgi:transcriptional regulator with XRE-family HTH domain